VEPRNAENSGATTSLRTVPIGDTTAFRNACGAPTCDVVDDVSVDAGDIDAADITVGATAAAFAVGVAACAAGADSAVVAVLAVPVDWLF
jgi:hypothetical protein